MRRGPQAKIAANGKLDSAIGRLLLLTENYPQLRSSDQFMRLQDELSGTENRISVARKRYNDSIQDYNTFILQFPNNIWAGMAGYQAEQCLLCSQSRGSDCSFGEVLSFTVYLSCVAKTKSDCWYPSAYSLENQPNGILFL